LDGGRRAKEHGFQENFMFRLAAFIGVACLALAAYSLTAASKLLPQERPRNPKDEKPIPERENLRRVSNLSYHAKFSVN
jgi:hypothetical protein